MEWLGVVLAAIVSVIGGVVTLYLGNRVRKGAGLPLDIEAKIRQEIQEYADALEKNNERLEGEVKELMAAKDACEERIELAEEREREMLSRLDTAEATIIRLRIRLGEDVGA